MTKIVYVADFEYGKPNLIEVEVKTETSKTIVPVDDFGTAIIGIYTYAGKRIMKDDRVFDSKYEAMCWLRGQICQHMLSMRKAFDALERYDLQIAEMQRHLEDA